MTLPLDSKIFGPLFTDAEVAGLFDDAAFLRTMLEIEGALARVEAMLGLIPSAAGERISRIADSLVLDPQQIGKAMLRDGVPVISLVKALREAVGRETYLELEDLGI